MAKERSPNYPYIGLSAALEAVRRLYGKDRRSPVSSETFAKALGHVSLSGPAASKGAAVRQFGLMESVSTGKYRVSDDALTLMLKKPGDPEYDQTIRRVALKPPLFAELFSAYPEASDDTLRFHLIKDRKFSEDGASRALRSFRDTISVAKLTPESYNTPDDGASDVETDDQSLRSDGRNGQVRGSRSSEGERKKGAAVAYSWPLGGGNKVDLGFKDEPTQAQLDVMLAQLQIMRNVAPTESSKDEPEGDGG